MAQLEEPLSIRQLEVFVALVEEGSFTRAARSLGLSQSTVSGHISDLERRLGQKVVERSRRGVHPTSVGEALLAPARETLQSERQARMAVEELTGLLRGGLSVGGSTIPVTYLLPTWLRAYHEAHPQIRLRLVTGDSRDILERVLGSDIELGVIGSVPDAPGLDSVKVAEDHLVLIAPPHHPLAQAQAISPDAVLEHGIVLREEGSGTREATLDLLGLTDSVSLLKQLDVTCEVGSTEGQKAAVRAGLGVAIVSDLAVKDEIASGVLVGRQVVGAERARAFYLVTRKDAWLGPAARAFRETVTHRAPGGSGKSA